MFYRALLTTFLVVLVSGAVQAEKIILPQVVTHPTWTTTIRITSGELENRTVYPKFYNSDGTPWRGLNLGYFFSGVKETSDFGQVDFLLEGFGATSWTAWQAGDNVRVGYMVIDADPDTTKVSGFLNYRPDGEEVTNRVGLLAPKLATWVNLPFDRDTAVAVVNPSDETIKLSFQLIYQFIGFDQAEDVVALEIPPRGQRSLFINQWAPPELADQSYLGQVNVWSQSGAHQFAAISLNFPPSGVFTSVPVEVIKEGPFSEVVPSPTVLTIDSGGERLAFLDEDHFGYYRVKVPVGASELYIRYLFWESDTGSMMAAHGEFPRIRKVGSDFIFPPCDTKGTGEVSCTIQHPEPGRVVHPNLEYGSAFGRECIGSGELTPIMSSLSPPRSMRGGWRC